MRIVKPKLGRILYYYLGYLGAMELVVLGISYLSEGLIVPLGWALLLAGVGGVTILPFDHENKICTKPDYVIPIWQIVFSAFWVVVLGWFVFDRIFLGS